ncbi:GGDEF domain-containing protein [Roseibium sp. CAU 1637]|uniref:diguanylate cyclase n=1 Tax=Roseibium limicola TaxID=2816037 RepID=A0A939J8D8_9HYPH|nr:GGDEF domain-containing protein [Roseibium limicola]MBO0344769.1 GGDEF domain-containing protein [Roseibium limicola]
MTGLDNYTLLVVLAGVFAVIAVGLFLIWLGERSNMALLLWSSSMTLRVPAMFMWMSGADLAPFMSQFLAHLLLMASLGLSWGGARACARKNYEPIVMALPMVIWLVFSFFDGLYDSQSNRVVVFSLVTGFFLFAIGYEFLQVKGASKLLRAVISCSFFVCGISHVSRVGTTWIDPTAGFLLEGDALLNITLVAMLFFCFGAAIIATAIYWEGYIQELKAEVSRDPLTGLLTRRGFFERGTETLNERSEDSIGVMVLDLDYFKQINDTYGHQGGDAALMHFGRIATQYFGPSAVIGRIGGEEFAVIMQNLDRTTADCIVQSLSDTVATQPLEFEGKTIRLGVSGGLVLSNCPNLELHPFIRAADSALYQAKRKGRGRIEIGFYNGERSEKEPVSAAPMGLLRLA